VDESVPANVEHHRKQLIERITKLTNGVDARPRPIDALPRTQADLLFTRAEL